MCGIAGIIGQNAKNYQVEIRKMTDSMIHRGPDSSHYEFYENAALGHRRLSIIDLSDNGKQPMFSNTNNECIVLNGEIYGYQDLKRQYAEYPYHGGSDTEVILAMYQRKQENLIHELPGMFAFAIWDDRKQQLYCARDRFGEKPFYYAIGSNNEFIFASEIKAILASGLIQPKVNPEALSNYLQYGYVSTYQSIYSNIFTLPPAHQLIWKDGKIKVSRYYSLPARDRVISLSDAREEFTYLLKNAVKKQLVADVEVGSFLSGGLDSSSVVALVDEFLPHQTTISFGYDHKDSELKYAKEIADKYRTNHIEVHEQKKDLAESLRNISPFFDEPFADISFIPHYEICKNARKNLTVALSGDVGDELFGGYHFYTVENKLKNHFSYQNIIARFGLNLYQKIKPVSFLTQQNLRYDSILDFHLNSVRNDFNKEERKMLGISTDYQQGYSFTPDPNSLNDIMRVDLENYVPGNMMVKSDRMAMANSLEVRTPFLDLDFAEFCIQLPDHLKLTHENDKIILRETMGSYWTETIRNRHKQGFGLSVKSWFEEDSLMKFSDDLLKDKNNKVFNYIDFDATQRFLHKDNKHWNLLQLALWAHNNQSVL
ncbi:asparagine synthase (glutamine-hydrolyzing) [Chryseobacterium indologenes]|uniref:asparagine synthase (glutamine-hydrolyzing) n=1 Tax=Chryseobacterium indologenes TaxID=253 RepID=UPI0003E077CA|nr:asparagine synthase (glutamine-hydrolyzing) [Chryseobacterium indologenes]AYZ37516.1 asparagine synthase (glutamine-hydrolyzing) [Chryseobacterium indologenes]MBF6646388.1 asparagine synthase (glutamine-hydrolyzing) [Chryseobacterium indologenes]MBU3048292.1 asparagine synthase (glutamine-hydrolyzing) [Chryseobacterium indologenes]MEB4761886.1 asparagine synthase (glutamine-hydrolyzing) [Chryseobacterium indologenes]QPQ53470.1 asparagine synthase (glutamine-hydrolyzing) [Chryseobacterium in